MYFKNELSSRKVGYPRAPKTSYSRLTVSPAAAARFPPLARYVGSALGVFGVFGSLSPLLVKANTGTKGSSLDTKYVCSPTFKCRSSLWWFVAFCTCLSPRLDRMMCDEQIKSLTIYHGTKIYNDSIPILVPISLLVQLVLFLSSI